MARKSNISRRIERLLNDRVFRQAFAGSRRVRIVFLLAPFALFAFTALIRVQAATEPFGPRARQHSAMLLEQPAVANSQLAHPSTPVLSEAIAQADGPAPAAAPATPEMMAAIINPLDLIPAPPAAAPPAMAAPAQAAAAASSSQTEATFDRTLTVSGKIELSVATGSGSIHLTHGSGSQVQIHGHVHSREASDADKVHEIATNPPIQQDGNSITIGKQHEQQGTNHISIDYEIVAPADATLSAATGSGDVTDEGVGQGARLTTGSGSIEANGLQGGFTAQTGSGSIVIAEAGEGDAKAQTGSGSIDVKGVHGSLKAQTGSGSIKAAGTPSAEWKLQTGSGSIELTTGNAPMTLDASTGSGKIATENGMAMQASADHHHVHGQLNGGGPAVKIETGSGDIRIQ